MFSPSKIEKGVTAIFWIEATLLVLEFGRLLAIIIAATTFSDALETYLLQGEAKTPAHDIWIPVLIKSRIFFWSISSLIGLGLLIYLRKGITQKNSRRLDTWVSIGWVIIVFTCIETALEIFTGDLGKYTGMHIANFAYSIIYALIRTGENIVVLAFIENIQNQESIAETAEAEPIDHESIKDTNV